jgi:phage gp45-like
MIRGIVNAVTEGLIKLFSSSGRTGEVYDDREYFQHYGFTSRPLNGAEIIIINEGNHYLGIASCDRRYRLAVENGEVALYTDEGDHIHLKRNKIIEVISGNKLIATVENEVDITTKVAKINASTSCEITSPSVTVNASGSCVVNSPSIVLGEGATRTIVDERAIPVYNQHTHPGDGAPSPQMFVGNHSTNVTKAL